MTTPTVIPLPRPSAPQQTQVTMRQARLLFLSKGILGSIESHINNLPEPHKTAAQIEWEYATHVEKDNPIVQMLAEQLELSPETIDEWFEEAATL